MTQYYNHTKCHATLTVSTLLFALAKGRLNVYIYIYENCARAAVLIYTTQRKTEKHAFSDE